ncbi:hypothetical protein UFOVP116_145 [uncultured Caudovirales phage]|uniref:Lipoprotein n=1 Tax=uncultured Caudovirales phage TaxID=2100421 RepID=A0A6J5L645_9CAUD|nr:hypothetical protein UFOVP116_145 [uncultured Caudovirales phage]
MRYSIVSILALMVVGCSSSPTIQSTRQYDIARMVPDCNNKAAQIKFLNAQLETVEYTRDPRSYRASILNLVWEIRERCQ